MQLPVEAVPPPSLMVELIDLLGHFPTERDQRQAEVLATRLADLDCRARTQGAPPETMAAIKSARVLLDLAELPPLPPSEATR